MNEIQGNFSLKREEESTNMQFISQRSYKDAGNIFRICLAEKCLYVGMVNKKIFFDDDL